MPDPARIEKIFGDAMDLAGDERAAFLNAACADDAGLRQELESLLNADSSAHKFLEPIAAGPEAPDTRLGTQVGAWHLTRKIGEGGMGRVYFAERAGAAFHQQAAVKLLHAGLESQEMLRRFEQERRVLAELEHPNIARLTDGGATADGVPYLVMEYVDGTPLHRYCDSKGLQVSDRLRLFQEVCEAVQHAHRRLVVHRDLKPSNVLVTATGTVKLLDFGIAKVLEGGTPHHPAPDHTATAHRIMTPRYASPEQIQGGAITTASDVYSLGVMLFELLTGGRPYDTDRLSPLEIERVLTEGVSTRPSACVEDSAVSAREGGTRALSRRLEGDLDNIVLMAMRKEPDRRYGSVAQLSEDIRRHLDGFPVQARTDTLGYRASKFMARNRTLVVGGAALALALILGTAISIHFAVRESQQRELAESRFEDVRHLAATVLTEVDSAVASGGKTSAREAIVSTGLSYLDRLAAEPGDDPQILRDVAQGYFRVAKIQGDPKSMSLGHTEAALASAAKGQRVADRLAAVDPTSTDSRLVGVEGHLLAGDLARLVGDFEVAMSHLRSAVRIRESISSNDPASDLKAPRLDTASFQLGYTLERFKKPKEAIPHFLRAQEIEDELLSRHPEETELFEAKVTTLTALSQAYRFEGQPEKVPELLTPLRDQLATRAETDLELRPTLANLRYNLGWAFVAQGDTASGIVEIASTTAFYGALADADPTDMTAHRNRAAGLHDLGELEYLRGRGAAGLVHFEELLRLRRHVVSHSPETQLFRDELIAALEATAQLLQDLGRSESALRHQREAASLALIE